MTKPFLRSVRAVVLASALVTSACATNEPVSDEPVSNGSASNESAPTAATSPTTTEGPTTTEERSGEPVTSNERVPTTEAADDESACVRLTDFATDAETGAWTIVNDDVMGGRSAGGASFTDSVMTFTGTINTDGGGFASLRLPIVEGTLADVEVIRLRVRTDGRAYKLTMRDSLEGRDNRTSHQAPIPPSAVGEWEVVEVSLADLTANVFGRSVETDPFVPELGNRIGLMMSDGIDGDFSLDVDWIDLCPPANQ